MHRAALGERYDPWADLARRPHITLAITRLPHGNGWYMHDVPGIALDDRLDRVARRCALAHELAHIDLGHTHQVAGTGPGTSRIQRRREREADTLADARLVLLDDLARAIAVGLCPEEVAHELDVTLDVVHRRIQQLTARERAFVKQQTWGRTA
jgi:Zn-dependent peptidase ImmA (M78 family)